MVENTRHDTVHHAIKNTGDIGDRFALTQTNLVRGGKIERIASEVAHAYVKADACAQGWFWKIMLKPCP